MTTAIEIEGLRYRASSEFAIEDLSLQVPSGALYGFLGPNGCGKTTPIGVMDRCLRVLELPMEEFRSGNKRIRVAGSIGSDPVGTPFTVLSREPEAGDLESWVVRGWRPDMKEWFARDGDRKS